MGSVFLATESFSDTAQFPDTSQRPSDIQLDALNAQIPNQPDMIAGVGYGNSQLAYPGSEGLALDYRSAVDTVLQISSVLNLQFEIKNSEQAGLHPGRSADVLVGDQKIGFVGELHPDLADQYHLPRTAVFELSLSELWGSLNPVVASAVYTYPAATQDLSLVVDENLQAAELQATVVRGAGELLESIRTIDVYRGEGLGEGKKSVTFALMFRASDRTLTQEEATESRNAAVALANKLHGAELRGV